MPLFLIPYLNTAKSPSAKLKNFSVAIIPNDIIATILKHALGIFGLFQK